MLVGLVLVAALAGGYVFRKPLLDAVRTSSHHPAKTWFAPYVDVSLTPPLDFQEAATDPAKDVALGFVAAPSGGACTPAWGGHVSLDAAQHAIDLDRRILRLRERGGDVLVSFGGAGGVDLARACPTAAALAGAYSSVVRRYKPTTIEVDVEGAALRDRAAAARRGVALHRLQVAAKHKRLAVWLALPVGTHGLSKDARQVLAATLAAHVRLAGVNLVARDFGTRLHPTKDLVHAIRSALDAAHRQVLDADAKAGLDTSSSRAWQQLGLTPMLGLNDIVTERLGEKQARAVLDLANQHQLARVSILSLNRDTPCGPNVLSLEVVATSCSGIAQRPLAFSTIFAALPGKNPGGRHRKSLPARTFVDRIATSPYPIWRPEAGYGKGWRVVWKGAVYVAKWFNTSQTPDAPVASETQTPWRVVGPVLAGEHPRALPHPKAGTYPEWALEKQYHVGDRVLWKGLAYEAKWTTQRDTPDTPVPNAADTPWKPLFVPLGAPGA